MTGTIVTFVLALAIGWGFYRGIRKIVRKFTKNQSDCCSSSACGNCTCQCATKK